ncbi:MAG: helix-turn-helix transcriptional regulator [Ruminococcaceae bacterium]|nr:helix-turn-helix transcriptional regulator [Oscillospiraceae bacterium]
MKDTKIRLAQNIIKLRTLRDMTQLELADQLHYSDKTISKWERAESTPDIAALVEMAEFFHVSLDALVMSDKPEQVAKLREQGAGKYNRHIISYLAEAAVWLLVLLAFVITTMILQEVTFQWLYFVFALPLAIVVRLVFNTLWFNPRRNYLIISCLMWSVLFAIHMSFLYFSIQTALLYLPGIIGQISIILWSFVRRRNKE